MPGFAAYTAGQLYVQVISQMTRNQPGRGQGELRGLNPKWPI